MPTRKVNRPERRAPLPTVLPREEKAKRGRTTTLETPLNIRTAGVTLPPPLRDYLRQRLGFKLGKFALGMRRVSVRLVGESGPHGPPTLVCRIKVMLDPATDIVVEHAHDDLRTAIDGAVERVERSVRRALEKVRDQRR